jgi:4-amino-4-deoxy-L-arabinose transferase-like glycosyltransferase
MLHLAPRLLMGALAVVDTFLIYKIAERRYNNRNIVFMTAILFAAVPMSWLVRRILLDSLILPFLLFLILFAVEIKNSNIKNSDNPNYELGSKNDLDNKISLLTLLSGIFLGLAIFTKIPAVVMLPLVSFLIYNSAKVSYSDYYARKNKLKILGL